MHHRMIYGKSAVSIATPEHNDLHVLKAEPVEIDKHDKSETELVQQALAQPIGERSLGSLVQTGDEVCIVTSDITRPMPSHKVLPNVVGELSDAGIRHQNIKIVFALGMHRQHSRKEQEQIVGKEIASTGIRLLDSDPNDVSCIGKTPKGTPVHVFREVLQSDVIICLGNIEFHYFAGYSGGLKAILPGVCGEETIRHNHRMMMQVQARRGQIIANPVREDIDSVLELIDVDFIVNVIVDSEKNIEGVVAGHPIEAHRRGAELLNERNGINMTSKAHLVIADAGGAPKDINLYQSHKALDSATDFAVPGAPILLVAKCEEGYGNEKFESWLTQFSSTVVREKIRQDFELGGHKAAVLSRITTEHPVWLVSQLTERLTRQANMHSLCPQQGRIHLPDSLWNQAKDTFNRSEAEKEIVAIVPNAASVCPV